MVYWSLLTEIIALLLIAVLLLSLSTYKKVNTHSLKLYSACLLLAGGSIIWNILCVVLIRGSENVPIGLNIFVNSIYFTLEVIMCSVTAMYIFEKMLEHVYDQFCIRRARLILVLLTLLYTLLVIVNLKTGIIFWFDTEGGYHRGILNWAGYAVLAIEMVLLLICALRHFSSIGKDMRHSLRIFPPVVAALVVIQLLDHELLLNGMIAAFVDMILFISFLCQRKETDNVTGLGNRDGFFSELSLRIAGEQHFQILLIFPKDFGAVNQRYGYQIGNEFLYAISCWIENTYKEAMAFRYVGVSFAVILPYTEEEQAKKYVSEFQARFEQPWVIGWRKEFLNVSFSDMIYTRGCEKENQLMMILDYMLSLAKHSGSKYVPYNKKASDDFLEKQKIVDCVRNAISEKKFEVWYQPVFFPENNVFSSAEALVRLRDGEEGFIPPDRFIPIAEELGIVDDIFWQVLEQVCCFIKDNPETAPDTISLNMSLEQFEEPMLLEKIMRILNRWKVPLNRLRFEITERVIAADTFYSEQLIRRMEKEGFCFYLDDFGIGYSNFASVMHYHFECIKLDKSFIDIAQKDVKGRRMIRGMIGLFHEIGIEVIAEGTETREQMEMLIALGADKIQGFYFAKPMAQKDLLAFLKRPVCHS